MNCSIGLLESGVLQCHVAGILNVSYVRPYAGSMGQEFILMGNNFRTHRAHTTNAYLERETIVHMDCPA